MNAIREPTAPSLSSSIESALRTAMADVLGLEHVGKDENFFRLGGNSLAMIEVIAQTQRTLSIPFDPNPAIDTFFEDGTLRALIERIESLVVDSRSRRAEPGT